MRPEQSPPILPDKDEANGLKADDIVLTNIVTSNNFSDQPYHKGSEDREYL